jgi:hypothetical protein
MEILLWLVPPAVVAVLAMLGVAWAGREGRGVVDPEVATERLARAMSRETDPVRRAVVTRPAAERSTGVAVRRSQETRRSA